MKKIVSLILLLCLLVPMVPSFALESTDTGTITVTKLDTTETGNVPRSGITYTIQQTHQIDSNGNMIKGGSYNTTAVTDDSGVATFNNVPVGRYEVRETVVPTGMIINNTTYTIDLPDQNSTGQGPDNHTANLLFKPSSTFSVEKTQSLDGKNYQLYEANNPMLVMEDTEYFYQIKTNIDSPEDNKTPIKGITISDTFTSPITLATNSEISVSSNSGQLTVSTDYTIDTTNGLQITLTESGINKLQYNDEIIVTFKAIIPSDSNLTDAAANMASATINFTDAVGNTDNTSVANSANTYTALPSNNLTLTKVDSANSELVLRGAEFQLYRVETDGATDNGIRVGSVQTTNDNGQIVFDNLSPGNYYLVETKAPAGYNMLSEPVPVTVVENQDNTITIQNVKTIIMPGTGGFGPILYALMGVVAVILAFYFILGAKRRKEEAR